MRVSPGMFAAITERYHPPPCWTVSLHLCTSLPPRWVRAGGGEWYQHKDKQERKGEDRFLATLEHLICAPAWTTPEYFHFVSQHVPWFLSLI